MVESMGYIGWLATFALLVKRGLTSSMFQVERDQSSCWSYLKGHKSRDDKRTRTIDNEIYEIQQIRLHKGKGSCGKHERMSSASNFPPETGNFLKCCIYISLPSSHARNIASLQQSSSFCHIMNATNIFWNSGNFQNQKWPPFFNSYTNTGWHKLY